MSIVQHSAPTEWMVAVVGLNHMVPSLVDHGMHRIMVFKGNQDMRLQLRSWVEAQEGSSRGRKRRARAGGKDEAGGDGSSSGTSNTSEENSSSHEEEDEVSLGTKFHGHGTDGKPMESASIVAAAEGDVRVDVQTTGPMQSISMGEKSQADTELCGGNLHVHSDMQDMEVPHVSITDAATMDSNRDVGNVGGSTGLGSSVQTDRERIQLISALTYEKEGDYFIDRLSRMWVQEKPSGHIGIADAERWGTYLGNFFKRIEISDLLSRQAYGTGHRQDSSFTAVQDASASRVMTTSEAPSAEACTGEELQRVLETPPE
jgi:hypothetical protein